MGYPNYFKELRYPLLCSPKYDGIRGIVWGGVVMSRKFKPLPSEQVQSEFGYLDCLDGELIEGDPHDHDVYNRTQSFVMSERKPGSLRFFVFDTVKPNMAYTMYLDRYEYLLGLKKSGNLSDKVVIVEQELVEDEAELLAFETKALSRGFEGIIMRDPRGWYKQGRGTWKEGLIYKLKRFEDAEGVVVDFQEQRENTNELKWDALGYAERSTNKEGLLAANTLGAFIVDYGGQILSVAPGIFDYDERRRIWLNKDLYRGAGLKFRFFGRGMKDLPRFPRAIGFRVQEID